MSKTRELAKNTAVLGAGRVIGQLAAFIALPIYTLFLTPSEFGVADLIITYSAVLVPILMLQLDRGAFRYIIEHSASRAAVARVISSSFFTLLTIATSIIGLYLLVGLFVEVPYYLYVPALIITSILSTFFLQVARGIGKNALYTIASAVNGVTLLGSVCLALIVFNMGTEGVIAAIALGYGATTLFLFVKLKLYKYIRVSMIDTSTRKDLLLYSLPLIPSSIAWWVISAADRTIITAFMGITYTGIYAIAFRYSSIFMALYAIFDMAWTESASRHINSKDKSAYFTATYNRSLRVFGSLGLLFISFIPLVFGLLVSLEYKEAYMYMPLLIIAALMNSIVASYSALYIATKNTKKVMTTSIMAAAISIVLNITLIPIIGLYAAAAASIVAFSLMALLRYRDIQRYVKFSYSRSLILSMVAAYTLVVALYYVNIPVVSYVGFIVTAACAALINRSDATRAVRYLQGRPGRKAK